MTYDDRLKGMLNSAEELIESAGSVEEPNLFPQTEPEPEFDYTLLDMIVNHQRESYPGDITEYEKIAMERAIRAGIEDVKEFKKGSFRCMLRQISKAELLTASTGAWKLMDENDELFDKIWGKNIEDGNLTRPEKIVLIEYNLTRSIYMVYLSMRDFDPYIKNIEVSEGQREVINFLKTIPHIYELIKIVKYMNGIGEESTNVVGRFLTNRGSGGDSRRI